MLTVRLKFGHELIDAVDDNQKTETVRYGLEAERKPTPGDKLVLLDEDGERFGTASVSLVSTLSAGAYARIQVPNRYRTVDELLEALRTYYPDEPVSTFTPGVQLTSIVWTEYQPDPTYWEREVAPGGERR